MTPPPIMLTSTRVVLVEGKDEEVLLQHYMASIEVTGVQVVSVVGKDNIRLQLRTLKTTPGFDAVTHLALVRDADTDWNAAFDSVRGALRDAQLPVPENPLVLANGSPAVAVLILPDKDETGDLETVCLDSVGGDPAFPCVDGYLECLQRAGADLSKDGNKRKLLTFLASRPVVHGTIGGAARGKVWRFETDAFKPIRQLFELVKA